MTCNDKNIKKCRSIDNMKRWKAGNCLNNNGTYEFDIVCVDDSLHRTFVTVGDDILYTLFTI